MSVLAPSSEPLTTSLLPQPILRLPFPYKLYKLLDDADSGIHSDIVSWLPQGNGFKIHDSKAFCHTIMKTYFNQSKLKSFTRQLYLYGFLKVSEGPNEGAFFHPKFVRGDREGCLSIRRNQFEGDRRQSKQRTKNLLLPSSSSSRMIQEASKKTTTIASRGVPGGGVALVDAAAMSGLSGGSTDRIPPTTARSSSMPSSSLYTSGPLPLPPFDNSGEPFKAALTIFDKVFNLIDDDGSCDSCTRNATTSTSAPQVHSISQGRRHLLQTLMMRKNDQEQEPMTPSSSHVPLNHTMIQPMGCSSSWDGSSNRLYTRGGMNHTISADCLHSHHSFSSTAPGRAETDDDWLEKLEGSLGEPLLMRADHDAHSSSLMDFFDFSPRPIEEMFDGQHYSCGYLPTTPPRDGSCSAMIPPSSLVRATMDQQHEHYHHHSHPKVRHGGDRLFSGSTTTTTTGQHIQGLPV